MVTPFVLICSYRTHQLSRWDGIVVGYKSTSYGPPTLIWFFQVWKMLFSFSRFSMIFQAIGNPVRHTLNMTYWISIFTKLLPNAPLLSLVWFILDFRPIVTQNKFFSADTLDVSGIIAKFNVYVTSAIIPRTENINNAFWFVHIFIKTLSFSLLWRRISL